MGVKSMYVLGIDGGGTKTTGFVSDENGNVYMQAITGGSNPNTLTNKEFEIVLSGLLLQLKIQNDVIYDQISVCFAGMAGVGESGRDAEVVRILGKYLHPTTKIIVKNDAFNALYSGTLGDVGIVQIAGTGAITFGVNEEEKMVRSGGWGYLFDDEGSGFHLGNEALRAVFKEYDLRGPNTSLTSKILNYFQLKRVPDIVAIVYGKEHSRSVIAPLAPLVVEAAETNDEVAKKIVQKASEKMMLSIQTCHNHLFESNHPTNIVLSGGVMTSSELFIQNFKALSSETLPHVKFQLAQVPPVGGAIIAGLKSQNVVLPQDFVERFNEQVRNMVKQ